MSIIEEIQATQAKYTYTKNKNTYLTPPDLIQKALQILALHKGVAKIYKFDCDVCCSNENIPALSYFKCGEFDGLKENWKNYNYCNPPFDECAKWVKKAYTEQLRGNTSILLIPVRTETAYWHNYILYNEDVKIIWLRKGPKFWHPETKKEMGVFKNALAFVLFKGVGNE